MVIDDKTLETATLELQEMSPESLNIPKDFVTRWIDLKNAKDKIIEELNISEKIKRGEGFPPNYDNDACSTKFESVTPRGFGLIEFSDDYGTPCSLQESSSAQVHRIWLGVNDPTESHTGRMHLSVESFTSIINEGKRLFGDSMSPVQRMEIYDPAENL